MRKAFVALTTLYFLLSAETSESFAFPGDKIPGCGNTAVSMSHCRDNLDIPHEGMENIILEEEQRVETHLRIRQPLVLHENTLPRVAYTVRYRPRSRVINALLPPSHHSYSLRAPPELS